MGANTRDATALAQFVGTKPIYPYGPGFPGIVYIHVDMSSVAASLGVVIDGNNNDIIQVWDIPALTYIHTVAVYLWTPEGAAATITVGDGTQAAGYLASFSINGAAATTKMTLITDAYGATGGCSYNATDTLDITFGTDTDIDTAVFDIAVLCTQFQFPPRGTTSPSAWH